MTRDLLMYFTILVGLGVASAASADSFFQVTDGQWTGNGWIRAKSGSLKQATKCRLALKYNDKNKRLQIKGKCAGGGRSSRVSGKIASVNVDKYEASWRILGKFSANNILGMRVRDDVHFKWNEQNKETEELETLNMTWNIASNKISIVFWEQNRRDMPFSTLFLTRR